MSWFRARRDELLAELETRGPAPRAAPGTRTTRRRVLVSPDGAGGGRAPRRRRERLRRGHPVDDELAVDGIDEVLDWFLVLPGRRRRLRTPRAAAPSRSAPADRIWRLALRPDAVDISRAPGPSDAVVSGEPSELYLWLWGRRPDSAVQLEGDAGPAGRAARAPARRHPVGRMPSYDVVVAGLGGFGSAAAAHLATRGVRVLGLDPRPRRTPRAPATARPGSCGRSTSRGRPTCRCCGVPTSCGTSSRTRPARRCCTAPVGCSSAGPDTRVFRGSLESAQHWDLEHEVLDSGRGARAVPGTAPAGRGRRALRAAGRCGAAGVRRRRAPAPGRGRRSRAAARRGRHRLGRDGRRRARRDHAGSRRHRGPGARPGAMGTRAGPGWTCRWSSSAGCSTGSPRRRSTTSARVGCRSGSGTARTAPRCTARRPRPALTTSSPRCTSPPSGPPTRGASTSSRRCSGAVPAPRVAAHPRGGVLVHAHAGRELRGRAASRVRPRGGRVRVLGPRLQVHPGARRGARRPGDRGAHRRST